MICTLRVLPMLIWLSIVSAYAAHEPVEPKSTDAVEGVAPDTKTPMVPEYRSPLESFKRYSDVEQIPWRQANDRVGEIGGWRVYAREAFEESEDSANNGQSENQQ